MTTLSESERAKVREWAEGGNPPPHRYVVIGAQANIAATYHLYVCLYPDAPSVRTFKEDVPPRMQLPDVRTLLRECKLPDTGESNYELYMRRMFPVLPAKDAWGVGVAQAQRFGLPLALLAYGVTTRRGVPRAQLVVNSLLSPTKLLREFRRAADTR
jgi:hypothetical protein